MSSFLQPSMPASAHGAEHGDPRPVRLVVLAIVLAASSAASGQLQMPREPERFGYRVVRSFPHDTGGFTQGLLYRDGVLYESTGLNGRSSLRKVELETGKVLKIHRLEHQFFGEGLADWNDRLIQLTWRSGTGIVYDLNSFEEIERFEYPGEGWGLTHDGERLIMSDGTPELRLLDPETLAETGRLTVTYKGQGLRGLNELEYIDGKVWANVWPTDHIVMIDPADGQVTGHLDLAGILPREQRRGSEDVLNGIAWDARQRRLFVTGKNWPLLFEIEPTPAP